jgi:hypothetical protein
MRQFGASDKLFLGRKSIPYRDINGRSVRRFFVPGRLR